MLITEDTPQGTYIIRSYTADSITVNDTTYRHSLIVSANHLNPNWPVQNIELLDLADLQAIIDLQPELILFGTGDKFKQPKAEILAYLAAHNLGFEYMDTQAACRTYSALTAEGRAVTAALILNSQSNHE